MRLVLIGLVAGFFSALFGVGGGIVIVPLLLLVSGWEMRPATATSLAAIGITATAGVVTYVVHGEVEPVRRRDHLADRARGEEAGELGHPVVTELVLAVQDQVAAALAGRLVDRVAPQVDDSRVPGRLRRR